MESDSSNTFPLILISPWGEEYHYKSQRLNEARYEGINQDGKRHTLVYSQAIDKGYVPDFKTTGTK